MSAYTEKIETLTGLDWWRVFLLNGDFAGTIVRRDLGFVATPLHRKKLQESFDNIDRAISYVAGVAETERNS